MELYDLMSPVENKLAIMAEVTHSPLGGTMELLPLCNMNCKMCYIRLSKEQMEAQGRMLSCDEWLRIANEAKARGVLFFLITGGEPLIYPDFKRLYRELHHMGFIVTVNTNATLIDESWADFFAEYPCRRFNITLYGKDDETYGRLCHNPNGFTQVMRAVHLLKERNLAVRLTCSVTPENMDQMKEIYAIADRLEVPLEINSYMFPPARKGLCDGTLYRMSPEEAAISVIETYKEKVHTKEIKIAVENTLQKIKYPEDLSKITGLSCRAGHSGFWLNWKGEMLPCGMFDQPKISLLEYSFSECWDYIVRETRKLSRCKECEVCDKRSICKTCAAACLTETGRIDGKPEYLCQMTEALYRILLEYKEQSGVD